MQNTREETAFSETIQKNNIQDATHRHVTLDQAFIVNPKDLNEWYWFNTQKNQWQPTYSLKGSPTIYKL